MNTQNVPMVVNWESELKGATALLKSGLAPRDLRTAEACLFVILAGRDLGLSPVQSLRSIRPIQGKIELSADLQLGLFHREGGKTRWIKLTDAEVKLELSAPWLTEPHVSHWTMEDAKRAGLATNDNWKKYPKAMLRSRAITSGLKDIGYLPGSGVYAPGEISGQAVVDVQTGEVLPTEDQQASELAQMPKPQQTSAAEGALTRVDDDVSLKVMEWRGRIEDAFFAKDPDQAFAIYKDAKDELEGADAQAALWSSLNSKCRSTLTQMQNVETLKKNVPPPVQDRQQQREADLALLREQGSLRTLQEANTRLKEDAGEDKERRKWILEETLACKAALELAEKRAAGV